MLLSLNPCNPDIDSTYQADAFNMDTLDRELYTDMRFFAARHQNLLYCFQMLFPPFTIALIVAYSCSSYHSAKTYAEKHTKCQDLKYLFLNSAQ